MGDAKDSFVDLVKKPLQGAGYVVGEVTGANAAREAAEKAAAQQKADAEAQIDVFNKKTLDDQAAADAKDLRDKKNANARATTQTNPKANIGRGGTLLTSPLGVVGVQAEASGKTLLGS